jgi:hypothetical protein
MLSPSYLYSISKHPQQYINIIASEESNRQERSCGESLFSLEAKGRLSNEAMLDSNGGIL